MYIHVCTRIYSSVFGFGPGFVGGFNILLYKWSPKVRDCDIIIEWSIFWTLSNVLPITAAARSKAWTVYAHSNAGIVGSYPTQGMDVCVCVYSVFVLFCVQVEALRRADPRPRSPTDCV
jgi:hypothetical protein